MEKPETAHVSVLLSIYNEPLEYIKQSLISILEQTYKSIELIIIVDNPSIDEEIVKYLSGLPDNVKVLYNDENIGLAMSMNRAFSFSHGEYIARMDADDIAYPIRIEKEIDELKLKKADLVCTYYDVIDEEGKLVENKYRLYSNDTLEKLLPYKNTIHHPTVLMKREAFKNVGGYRDFPCAQDYDVWLRMYSKGMKFCVVEEKLLYYRIRKDGISQKKQMKQSLTTRYIRHLYRERRQHIDDTYSKENYENFLSQHGAYNENVILKYEKNRKLKDDIDMLRNRKSIKKTALKLLLFSRSPFHREEYMSFLLDRFLELYETRIGLIKKGRK